MRPTPAAAAMSAMLISGSRARQSVAASRIAAMLRRASARRAFGAVLWASLAGISANSFSRTTVFELSLGVITQTREFMLAQSGAEEGIAVQSLGRESRVRGPERV